MICVENVLVTCVPPKRIKYLIKKLYKNIMLILLENTRKRLKTPDVYVYAVWSQFISSLSIYRVFTKESRF